MLCCRSCTPTCTWKRFMVLSFRGEFCGHAHPRVAAAVLGEIADKAVHVAEVCRIDYEPPFLPAAREAGANQVREMKRQRCGRQVELFAEDAGGEAGRAGLHQQLERCEARAMSECRQRFDRLRCFHISRIMEMM